MVSRIAGGPVDVVVVGLGPAGSTAARVLAGAGLRVCAVQALPGPGGRSATAAAAPTVRRGPGEEALPAATAQAGADGPGGSKLLAAPQSYRLDPWVLRMRTRTLQRYGPAGLPAGTGPDDLIDWPLDWDDLLTYYRRVERLEAVAPRPGTAWTRRMHSAATDLGWHPFGAPAAAQHDVSRLLDRQAVRVLTGTATRIRTCGTGTVTGLEWLDPSGGCERIDCGAVVLAAAPVASARLLLLSGIDAGGLVGGYLMAHHSFVVHGWFPGQDLGRDAGGPAQAVAVADFDADGFDHTATGFLGGSILQAAMTGPRSPAWVEAAAAGLDRVDLPAGADRGDGADRADWVAGHAEQIGTVWAQPDQLPRPHNRIDLDPVHCDASGRPVARITLDLADDDRRRARFLRERMAAWLVGAGAQDVWSPGQVVQPLGTHLYGGARMAAGPEAGVVDGYGRAFTVPGLVIAGSAVFPGTGGRGPVQTVEALAWRSADRLVADLR